MKLYGKKRKNQRREEAVERTKKREKRTVIEQLSRISGRRGDSNKEIKRIQKALEMTEEEHDFNCNNEVSLT